MLLMGRNASRYRNDESEAGLDWNSVLAAVPGTGYPRRRPSGKDRIKPAAYSFSHSGSAYRPMRSLLSSWRTPWQGNSGSGVSSRGLAHRRVLLTWLARTSTLSSRSSLPAERGQPGHGHAVGLFW